MVKAVGENYHTPVVVGIARSMIVDLQAEYKNVTCELTAYLAHGTNPQGSAMALSLLHALGFDDMYRCQPMRLSGTDSLSAAVNRMCQEGDLASALATQEEMIFDLCLNGKSGFDEAKAARLADYVQCYVYIHQKAAARYKQLWGRVYKDKECFSLPPLHTLLLLQYGGKIIMDFPTALAESPLAEEKDMLGRTLLHLALDLGYLWPMREHVDQGPLHNMANATDKFGRLPRDVVCATNHPKLAALLKTMTTSLVEPDGASRSVQRPAVSKTCDNNNLTHSLEDDGAGITPEDAEAATATPLALAVANKDFNMIKELYKKRVDFNTLDKEGEMNVLMRAVMQNDIKLVDVLLKYNADPNVYNTKGETALSYASKHGYVDIVRSLVARRKKIKVNLRESTAGGWSPLAHAAARGHVEIVQLILDNGVAFDDEIDRQFEPYGATPLILAVEAGCDAVVQLLLKSTANSKLCDDDGGSPLYIAVEMGHADIVSTIVAHEKMGFGTDDTEEWVDLIELAKEKGHTRIARTLETWMHL
jgi:ankyrin repeat protein